MCITSSCTVWLPPPPHQPRLSVWTESRGRRNFLDWESHRSRSWLQRASFCCKCHLTVWGVNAGPVLLAPPPPPPLHPLPPPSSSPLPHTRPRTTRDAWSWKPGTHFIAPSLLPAIALPLVLFPPSINNSHPPLLSFPSRFFSGPLPLFPPATGCSNCFH